MITEKMIDALPEALRIFGDWESREVLIEDEYLNPYYSQQIRNHSPDGFNWGYGGSGPAQFSLALLMLYLPVEDALRFYQGLKFDVISSLPQSNFSITLNLKQKIKQYAKEKNT